MRDDPSKTQSFKDTDLWNDQRYVNKVLVPVKPDPKAPIPEYKFTSNSLSGNERNRMFLRWGKNFADVTLVSGADNTADGRSFALLDFDEDGWQDIALMSLNAPRFKLYRNEIGKFSNNRSFRFRLVGGNESATPSSEFSNRDAIGARVLVCFESGKKVRLQKQAGEGFSSQNSQTLWIGIPQGDSVSRLEVRWPSGKETIVESPSNTEVITIEENASQ